MPRGYARQSWWASTKNALASLCLISISLNPVWGTDQEKVNLLFHVRTHDSARKVTSVGTPQVEAIKLVATIENRELTKDFDDVTLVIMLFARGYARGEDDKLLVVGRFEKIISLPRGQKIVITTPEFTTEYTEEAVIPTTLGQRGVIRQKVERAGYRYRGWIVAVKQGAGVLSWSSNLKWLPQDITPLLELPQNDLITEQELRALKHSEQNKKQRLN